MKKSKSTIFIILFSVFSFSFFTSNAVVCDVFVCNNATQEQITSACGTLRDQFGQPVVSGFGPLGSGSGSCAVCYNGGNCATTPSQPSCTEGTYSSTGYAPCIDAPIGKYVDIIGATSAKSCGAGKTTNQIKSTSINQCTTCPNGMTGSNPPGVGEGSCRYDYALMCPDIGTNWTYQPAGTPREIKDNNLNNTPFKVYEGVYLRGEEKEKVNRASQTLYGIQRKVGTKDWEWLPSPYAYKDAKLYLYYGFTSFYDTGSRIETFADGAGAFYTSVCDITCPAGSWSATGNNPGCGKCPAGTYQDARGQNTCKDAGVDKYVDTEGATKPIDCGPGKTTNGNTRATSINQCVPTTCPAGYAPSGSTGIYRAVSPLTGTSCFPCSPGYYSTEGATTCSQCPKGQYQDSTGQQNCKDAGVDKYVDTEGATQPTGCPAGKTTNGNTRATDVSQCVNVRQQDPPTSCQPGSAPVNGVCTQCPAGKYSTDGRACIQCAPNTTSLAGASSCFSKDSCPVDTGTVNTNIIQNNNNTVTQTSSGDGAINFANIVNSIITGVNNVINWTFNITIGK